MANYVDSLRARRLAVAQELANLDASAPGGLPNLAQQDGGTSVDHVGYRKSLYDELKMLDELIIANEMVDAAGDDNDGPVEEVTYGYIE